MHANNLIFSRKMMDKAAKKQMSVGLLEQICLLQQIFPSVLSKLAKQSQMQ
jgi:hypothetical protein